MRQPKTNRSRRAVALSPDTVRRLRQHRQQQLEDRLLLGPGYQDNGLVFATPLGSPISPFSLRRAWGHMAQATLMLQNGVRPKIVSERLGHSTVGITLDTYSHVLPTLQAQAAAGLDRLLAGDGRGPGGL